MNISINKDIINVSGNIYIMSDIHGCYNTFKRALKKINFSNNDFLIITGDIIDRGNEFNFDLINIVKESKNMLLLRGNHEEFFLRTANYELLESQWYKFGGKSTIAEYKKHTIDEQLDFYNYINKTDLYCIIDETYCISHNGYNIDLPCFYIDDMLDQEKTIITQYKTDWFNFFCSQDLHYIPRTKFKYKWITGHVPTIKYYNKANILIKENFIDVDCGCTYKNGRLGVLNLNTFEEIYIPIEKTDITKKNFE